MQSPDRVADSVRKEGREKQYRILDGGDDDDDNFTSPFFLLLKSIDVFLPMGSSGHGNYIIPSSSTIRTL